MKCYLIRHGKTEANERHLYCGSTDLPLSPLGRRELEGLHYSVQETQFVTSGMLRTEQSLEILFGKVPHRADPRFREVDFGAFEMLRYEDLKNREDYQRWITGDNEANVPPGGESGREMACRVIAAFQELGEDTVLVTHGGVIAAIMGRLFPEERKNRYQWQPKPGHGYLVEDGSYYIL